MIRCKAWQGQDLKGEWQVLRKLDGVRALSNGKRVLSRRGKPLYNLERHAGHFTDAEVWLGGFKATIQAVRTKHTGIQGVDPVIPRFAIYELDPPDPRLVLRWVADPTAAVIRGLLKKHKRRGEDGLVLRQGKRWLKVKHVETYDVEVLGVKPGTGKHLGRMGALLTTMGRVGTGFSDRQRREWRQTSRGAYSVIGEIIEVECNELTPGGKFKHARFVRLREDK